MMHGLGLGSMGIGFILLGVLSLVAAGGGLYILFRKRGALDDARRHDRIEAGDAGPAVARGPAAADVYRLARRYDGVLTVSIVVSELSIGPGEAQELLESLTDGQRVDMRVDDAGIVRFVFPELRS